jgi:hypothetical protein
MKITQAPQPPPAPPPFRSITIVLETADEVEQLQSVANHVVTEKLPFFKKLAAEFDALSPRLPYGESVDVVSQSARAWLKKYP